MSGNVLNFKCCLRWRPFFLGAVALALAGPLTAANLFSTAGKASAARVVVVQNPQATVAFKAQLEIVRVMVDAAITALTGSNSVAAAWGGLVKTNDVVGLKVYSTPGATSGTRPAVVAAVVAGLLAAHVPPDHIVIWGRHLSDLRCAGFGAVAEQFGVRLAGSVDAGWDEKVFYDTALLGNLLWGDLEFGKKDEGVGRKSFVSKLVSHDLTKIINVMPLLNHKDAGVVGNLYGLAFGSVDNLQRFEGDAERLATAVPEIYALPALGDRVALNITDALLCQYAGSERGMLHYSAVLNELRFSRDPVALDTLSVAELERQRARAGFAAAKANPDLLHNAALLELGTNDPQKIQVETVK